MKRIKPITNFKHVVPFIGEQFRQQKPDACIIIDNQYS